MKHCSNRYPSKSQGYFSIQTRKPYRYKGNNEYGVPNCKWCASSQCPERNSISQKCNPNQNIFPIYNREQVSEPLQNSITSWEYEAENVDTNYQKQQLGNNLFIQNEGVQKSDAFISSHIFFILVPSYSNPTQCYILLI